MKLSLEAVINCFETSFDRKKISFMFVGIVIALVLTVIQELLVLNGNIAANILGILVSFLIFAVLMLVYGGASKLIYNDMTGKEINIGDAVAFIKSKAVPLIFTPIVLALSAIAFVLVELLLTWILSLIPLVGAIIIGLLFGPLVIVNIFALLILTIGIKLSFSIIAANETGVADTLRHVFNLAKKHSLALLASFAAASMILIPAIFIIIIFAALGLIVSVGISWPLAQNIIDALQYGEIPAASSLTPFILPGISTGILGLIFLSYIYITSQAINMAIYLTVKDKN